MSTKISRYAFAPSEHEPTLAAIFEAVRALPSLDERALSRILKRHPKNGRDLFSKSELVRSARFLAERQGWTVAEVDETIAKLRTKPVRTQSGVAPVTVLTKPFPCPGECVFCPSDVRMPKSYLSQEPGAQRAAQHRFDPYAQTWGRLAAFHANGHPIDKIELIVLGGTWSHYPDSYQVWFIERCLAALNDFDGARALPLPQAEGLDFSQLNETVDGAAPGPRYNEIVGRFSRRPSVPPDQAGDVAILASAMVKNETARSRCVGLSLETRPDEVTDDEVLRLRRLGATKIQLGLQSLSDEVLRANKRGHDVAASRRAMGRLRRAGFKIQAHWMPNLLGSTPARDVEDFGRLFDDPELRPDELKIYPCSLIESAELVQHFQRGDWRPYTEAELVEVLTSCLLKVPEYCRVTRVIRDIPGQDIMVGNRVSNLREAVEEGVRRTGGRLKDIRSRELKDAAYDAQDLSLETASYSTGVGEEHFLQWVTSSGRLAAFLRLFFPCGPSFVAELNGSAIVRELHVYGTAMALHARDGLAAQHRGLGRSLLKVAAQRAHDRGFEYLAVISAIGTRGYYRSCGFRDGALYQHRSCSDSYGP
ncbi:MAG: tRNA uridine(34) 5-carboxymethylaminomethyl modification radical SAM/GNAT enzyme Elp3 [Deltaproteobacteria bacterium]|nr:tRNA uridine(34) 5-carboxymethylaminomethyl modification radical SAM/GNAT enzyme Elp3 [Deltaproteobacteria bacterium]